MPVRERASVPLLALIASFVSGCAEPPRATTGAAAAVTTASVQAPSVARYAVHIDTLDPAKVAQFEQARVEFVKELGRRGTSDHRGLYLRIGNDTYWSVVRFSSWADLDALGVRRKEAQQQLKGVVEEYDRLSDESLVFPHKNEIWTERLDFSYLPTGRDLREAVRVEIADLEPTADYAAAWAPIAAALEKMRYPVERRAFVSSFGSGRLLSFTLARGSELTEVPPLDRALAATLGEAEAQKLLGELAACVERTETRDVLARQDMASP
jgi:hypothetical protein